MAGGSSWQSLARGGRLDRETDYLNGEIALLGRLHGVPTPVNVGLQVLANEMARTGPAPGSWPVSDLAARLDRGPGGPLIQSRCSAAPTSWAGSDAGDPGSRSAGGGASRFHIARGRIAGGHRKPASQPRRRPAPHVLEGDREHAGEAGAPDRVPSCNRVKAPSPSAPSS